MIFRAKALWNWGVSLAFLLAPLVSPALRTWMKVDEPASLMLSQLFLMHAFVFGFGFWIVGGDPQRNVAIIRLGIAAQSLLVLIMTYYSWIDVLPLLQYLPALVDLVFAVLFSIELAKLQAVKR